MKLNIKNEYQFKCARKELALLEGALAAFLKESQNCSAPEELLQLTRESLEAPIEQVKNDIARFESLRQAKQLHFGTTLEFGEALISARIARGLTQDQLAKRVGLTKQSIQQYESSNFEVAALSKIRKIAAQLEVEVTGRIILGEEESFVVVIVEDEEDVRSNVVKFLASKEPDWEILSSPDLEGFRSILNERSVNLVITDLVFNGDVEVGLEITRLATQQVNTPPVILLTAYPEQLDPGQAHMVGAISIVQKFGMSKTSAATQIHSLAVRLLERKETLRNTTSAETLNKSCACVSNTSTSQSCS